jgi:hypothetical protein
MHGAGKIEKKTYGSAIKPYDTRNQNPKLLPGGADGTGYQNGPGREYDISEMS